MTTSAPSGAPPESPETPAAAAPRRRIAVFGSLAPQSRALLSPAARAVFERILAAVAQQAPAIARPLLDRSVAEGSLTREERHEVLAEFEANATAAGNRERPRQSFAVRRATREILAAMRRAAPGIAQPILAEAVADERLTTAQAQRILERVRDFPVSAFHPARGPSAA
jgi:RNase H-fold protein (predicted Holliday junction resolvase)